MQLLEPTDTPWVLLLFLGPGGIGVAPSLASFCAFSSCPLQHPQPPVPHELALSVKCTSGLVPHSGLVQFSHIQALTLAGLKYFLSAPTWERGHVLIACHLLPCVDLTWTQAVRVTGKGVSALPAVAGGYLPPQCPGWCRSRGFQWKAPLWAWGLILSVFAG